MKLFISFFIIFFCFFLFFFDVNSLIKPWSNSQEADFIFGGVDLYEFDGGVLQTNLMAKEVMFFEETFYLKDFSGVFYFLNDQFLKYRSVSGLYEFKSNRFVFYDFSSDVFFKDKPLIFIAGRAEWYLGSTEMFADDEIALTYDGYHISSTFLKINFLDQSLFFSQNVLGDIEL